MNLEMIKKRKLLVALVIITVLAFVFGLLFISILGHDNQELVKSSINGYFNGISDNNINYWNGLYSVLGKNLIGGIFIWIIGISIIGIFFVVFFLIFKSFLVGFSFSGIIYTYGFKGILVGLIYIIPEILGLFISFLLSYYSISFSLLLFNNLFRKKDYNKKVIVARYLKLLLICVIALIVTSIISVFVVPNILKML